MALISLRLRLALIYTTVFAFVLLVCGVVLYLSLERQLTQATDETLVELAGHTAAALGTGEHDPATLVHGELDPFSSPGVHVQVLDVNGAATAHSAGLGISALPESQAEIERALAGSPQFYTASAAGNRIRIYSLPLLHGEAVVGVLQVGKSYHDFDLLLAQFWQVAATVTVLSLLMAGTIGWAVAGRALRPVAEITETARAVAEAQAFDRRLSEKPYADEIGELALAFNHMLASLEKAYTAQRRFVADASHELRAPLTTIRGNLEFVMRATDLSPRARAESLADAMAETERMGRLVNDLLTLARADSGQRAERQLVPMQEVVSDVVRDSLPRATGLRLGLGHLDDLLVRGDRDRLRQLVLILVDNAIKYTPPGGTIKVSLNDVGGHAHLTVSDSGLGIEEADLPHIFERFFRADKARDRQNDGVGLGLAIAKSIVDEHEGTITVQSKPNGGSVFTVSLPRVNTVVLAPGQPGFST